MASSTPERLIQVAERLFAEHGVGQVSLRQIAEAAGQRNQGVVQYHFGSKEELLRAIVRYRVKPYNDRRLTLLAALDEQGRGKDLSGLVDAALRPLAELGASDRDYVAFVTDLTMQGMINDVFEGFTDELYAGGAILAPRLSDAVHHLPPEIREGRLATAFSMALFAIARYHDPQAKRLISLDTFIDDLVASISAFLLAPPPRTVKKTSG
jgi:AcrR family transcriptional regulator